MKNNHDIIYEHIHTYILSVYIFKWMGAYLICYIQWSVMDMHCVLHNFGIAIYSKSETSETLMIAA